MYRSVLFPRLDVGIAHQLEDSNIRSQLFHQPGPPHGHHERVNPVHMHRLTGIDVISRHGERLGQLARQGISDDNSCLADRVHGAEQRLEVK